MAAHSTAAAFRRLRRVRFHGNSLLANIPFKIVQSVKSSRNGAVVLRNLLTGRLMSVPATVRLYPVKRRR